MSEDSISWDKFIEKEITYELLSKDTLIKPNSTKEPIACDLNYDYKKLSIIKLLELQTDVSEFVKTIFLKTLVINDIMITNLKWLLETSKYIAIKYNQPEVIHYDRSDKPILRSSYKFCIFGYKCKQFNNGRYTCNNGQHLVFNFVVNDISELLNYISQYKECDIKEIQTSITTISFVIKHMYDELKMVNENDTSFLKTSRKI